MTSCVVLSFRQCRPLLFRSILINFNDDFGCAYILPLTCVCVFYMTKTPTTIFDNLHTSKAVVSCFLPIWWQKKTKYIYIYTTICSILAIRLCLYANSQQQLSRDMFFFLHKTFMICSNDEKVALNFDIYYVIGKYGGKKTKMRVNWNRNFQSIYHNQIRCVVAWHSADGVQRISLFFFLFFLFSPSFLSKGKVFTFSCEQKPNQTERK